MIITQQLNYLHQLKEIQQSVLGAYGGAKEIAPNINNPKPFTEEKHLQIFLRTNAHNLLLLQMEQNVNDEFYELFDKEIY